MTEDPVFSDITTTDEGGYENPLDFVGKGTPDHNPFSDYDDHYGVESDAENTTEGE